ncbi:uncharacterized protein LOC120914621 [Rana temporaria]|uniref:uncharacterized protein LOC120914621 n=1 Tax=Rana temporaria TaxID=8407 RepID=UPI001AAD9033|nr:uncharacterized protein LOC120914621 [Rana temporaria]XP_040181249.1 uncharacterized protein LOC120914621 [Rana temporaria]
MKKRNSLVAKKETTLSAKRISKRTLEQLSTSEDESAPEYVQAKSQKTIRKQAEAAAARQLLDALKDNEDEDEAAERCRKMENRIKHLEEENQQLRQLIVTELPGVLDTLKTTTAQLIALKNGGGSSSCVGVSCASASVPSEEFSSSPCQASYSRPKLMELHPGTGVYLSVSQWTAAHQCRTASAFVRAVLVCLFDTETLIKSNFKGGASKRLTDGEKRVQLDPVKTSALAAATLEMFPGTSKGVISDAINRKIAELKYRLKETLGTSTEYNK